MTADRLPVNAEDTTQHSSSTTSLGKDFFVVAVGVTLILLAFLLYGAVSGLGLKPEMPRVSTPVIDDYGNPIDVPEADLDPSAAHGFLRIGILAGFVALVTFITTLVLLRWSKKFNTQMKPHQDKGPERERAPLT